MSTKAVDVKSISGFFKNDHREIDAILRAVPFDSPEKAVAGFEEFDRRLERHIRWEEEILFPAVSAKAPMLEAGPIMVMGIEHRQIRDHKAGALKALREGDAARAKARTQAMAGVLSEHNLKEEQILYPACDELLSAEETRQVLARVRAS